MKKYLTRIIVLLVSCLLIFGCSEKSVQLKLKVYARSTSGDALADSRVFLDGKDMGLTNSFGTFEADVKLVSKKSHEIVVSREDQNFYFADYKETISTESITTNELAIIATLFSAPKPKVKRQVNTALEEAAASSQSDSELKQNETSIPVSVESLIEKAGFVAPSSSTKTVELSSSSKLTITQIGVQQGGENIVPSTSGTTFHVVGERNPLEGAIVFGCYDKSAPMVLCQTNSHGRCLVENDSELKKSRDFFVIKPGFITQLHSRPNQSELNIRVSMNPGRSVNVVALENIYGFETPIPQLIVKHEAIAGEAETNQCGFASWYFNLTSSLPTTQTDGQNQQFSAVSELFAERIQSVKEKPINTSSIKYLTFKRRQPVLASLHMHNVKPSGKWSSQNLKMFLSKSVEEDFALQVGQHIKATGLLEASEMTGSTHGGSWFLHSNGKSVTLHLDVRERFGSRHFSIQKSLDSLTAESLFLASTQAIFEFSNQIDRTEISEDKNLAETSRAKKPGSESTFGGRWLRIQTVPSNFEVASGTTGANLVHSNAWVDVGQDSEILLKAPPGFLNIKVQLPKPEGWYELTGANTQRFEEDLLSKAIAEIELNRYLEAINILGTLTRDHVQWKKAKLLQQAVSTVYLGKNDHNALAEIARESLTPLGEARIDSAVINGLIARTLVADEVSNESDRVLSLKETLKEIESSGILSKSLDSVGREGLLAQLIANRIKAQLASIEKSDQNLLLAESSLKKIKLELEKSNNDPVVKSVMASTRSRLEAAGIRAF